MNFFAVLLVDETDTGFSKDLIQLVNLADELDKMTYASSSQFRNFGGVKMWNIQEWRLVKPLALHKHLESVDEVYSRLKVAFVSGDIDHAL